MLPPTLLRNAEGGEAIPEPSPLMMIIFAAVFGAVAGVVFGFAQWLVLRRQTKQGAIWILANAAGWALAMSVIYLGASLPTAEWPIAAVVVDGALTGIVAGLSVGGVTGTGLVWLLRNQS